jgi:CRP-like cAMP-binding protein
VSSVTDSLIAVPFFRGIPSETLRGTRGLWNGRKLHTSRRIWNQGDPGDAVAILVEGHMEVRVDRHAVGQVGPGALLGEAGAFFRGLTRTADLVTTETCKILVLSRAGLGELRAMHPVVYAALLDEALLRASERVRGTTLRLARYGRGTQPQPSRERTSKLIQLVRRMQQELPSADEQPDLINLLRRLPLLSRAPNRVLQPIAKLFIPKAVPEGQVLFLEGEMGGTAWLVGSGGVAVARNTKGRKAEVLTTVTAGQMLGHNTLILRGERTASCVATSPSWLYRLETERFNTLREPARRAMRESMLYSLVVQLRRCTALLGDVLDDGSDGHTLSATLDQRATFKRLLKASGYLESHSWVEDMEVDFVVDDASARRHGE